MRNERVAFLSKYSAILGGAHYVVPIREFLKDIVKLCLRSTTLASTYDTFRQTVLDRFLEEGDDKYNFYFD